jgi:hypothetical protein
VSACPPGRRAAGEGRPGGSAASQSLARARRRTAGTWGFFGCAPRYDACTLSPAMPPSSPIEAREKKTPLWAVLAPVVYLLACGLAARAVLSNHDDAAGVPGLLAAIGLLPAFVIPVIFSTCKVRLSVVDRGLSIGGLLGARIEKVDDARLEHAPHGSALLHVVVRSGETRTFIVASYADAQRIVLLLPPVSAPAGALAI